MSDRKCSGCKRTFHYPLKGSCPYCVQESRIEQTLEPGYCRIEDLPRNTFIIHPQFGKVRLKSFDIEPAQFSDSKSPLIYNCQGEDARGQVSLIYRRGDAVRLADYKPPKPLSQREQRLARQEVSGGWFAPFLVSNTQPLPDAWFLPFLAVPVDWFQGFLFDPTFVTPKTYPADCPFCVDTGRDEETGEYCSCVLGGDLRRRRFKLPGSKSLKNIP